MQEVPQSPQNIVNFRPQSFSSSNNQPQNINNCSFAYLQQQGNKFQNSGSEQQNNLEQAPLFELLQRQPSIVNSISGSNICSECNKKFLKQAHLLRHINERHQNTRSFICKQPNCGKSFKRDSHLRRHMISHTHQKSYKCEKCIMAFGYKHHLDRHVKSVHEKQLLRCQSCSLSFVKKKAFIKHLQKNHPSQQNQKTEKTGQSYQKTKKIKKSQGKKEFKRSQPQKNQQNSQKSQNQLSVQINNQDSLFHEESDDMENANHENGILSKSFEIEGAEDSKRNEQIKQKLVFRKQSENEKQLLFRCIHPECVSAFGKLHELNRHLKQRHA